jgi:hypothetical protein
MLRRFDSVDYLNLIASIGLSILIIGFNLMTQSLVLRSSNEKLPSVGKKLKKYAYRIFIPLGMIIVVVGICFGYNITFISLGVMFILLAFPLIVQGKVLLSSQAALTRLGQKIKIYAWIYAIVGFVVVVIVGVITVYLFLTA